MIVGWILPLLIRRMTDDELKDSTDHRRFPKAAGETSDSSHDVSLSLSLRVKATLVSSRNH